jgi:hypothetical protein
MRVLPRVVLTAAALMVIAVPAMADRFAKTHRGARSHRLAIVRSSPTPFFGFNGGFFDNRAFNRGAVVPRRFQNRSEFFGAGLLDGFGGAWDSIAPPPAIVEPTIIMPSAAPSPPSHAAFDERPTVETTASGVEIVRGPGTRHTSR